MSESSCNQCGAHIKWFENKRGTCIPFNVEDIDDNFDPHTADSHWKTCRRTKPQEPELSRKQRTRPGYL